MLNLQENEHSEVGFRNVLLLDYILAIVRGNHNPNPNPNGIGI